jgi:hypothetical protein
MTGCEKLQVFKTIIMPMTVFVMNSFKRFQRSAKFLGHKMPMLQHILPANPNDLVAVINAVTALPIRILVSNEILPLTLIAAKSKLCQGVVGLSPLHINPAIGALKNNPLPTAELPAGVTAIAHLSHVCLENLATLLSATNSAVDRLILSYHFHQIFNRCHVLFPPIFNSGKQFSNSLMVIQ